MAVKKRATTKKRKGTKKTPRPSARPKKEPSAAASSPTQGSWSPDDYPVLVFDWTLERSGEDSFSVLGSLDESSAYTSGSTAGQTIPPLVFLDTVVSALNPVVPFSLKDETSPSPFIDGVLNYEPGESEPSLTITDLKYPGGSAARVILFPTSEASET